jgi:hypothetical protein
MRSSHCGAIAVAAPVVALLAFDFTSRLYIISPGFTRWFTVCAGFSSEHAGHLHSVENVLAQFGMSIPVTSSTVIF